MWVIIISIPTQPLPAAPKLTLDPTAITVYAKDLITSVTCTISTDEIPFNIRAMRYGEMVDLSGENYIFVQNGTSLTLQIRLEESYFQELEGAEFICEAYDPVTNGTIGNETAALNSASSVFRKVSCEL